MESKFKDNLQDIQEIKIPKNSSPTEKKKFYLGMTGSSTSHKIDAVEVECVYGNMKLDRMLADLICE
jgi:hypothetical protein